MYAKLAKKLSNKLLLSVWLVSLVSLVLASCGGGGGGGDDSGVTPVSVGSSSDPVDITGKTPYKGSVGRNGLSFYVIKNVDLTVSYTVSMTNLKSDADLSINSFHYSSNRYLQSEVITGVGGFSDLVFRIEDNSSDYTPTYNGTSFTLSMVPDGETININTGTLKSPQDITGLLPYDGISQSTGRSYYKISGLNVGQSYELQVTQQHENPNSTLIVNEGDITECRLQYGFIGFYVCTLNAMSDGAGGGEISFEFRTSSFAPLSIDLVAPNVSEGSVSSPVTIDLSTDFPYAGQVSGNGISYYQLTGLMPAQYYKMTAADLIQDFTVNWSDTLNNELCTGQLRVLEGSMHCIFETPADSLVNVNVDRSLAPNGTVFSFDIAPYTLAEAEGSIVSPVDVSTQMPYKAQVPGFIDAVTESDKSYYKISGLVPGSRAFISSAEIDNTLNSSLFAGVYTDATYTVSIASGSCGVGIGCKAYDVPASGDLHLMYYHNDTQNKNNLGGYFMIDLYQN